MIPIETWLKSFGFVRNPFETTEAKGEASYATDFLHETFVKPDGFDEIMGHPFHPKSSLIFAPKGRGKSTTRLMLAHFCWEGIFSKEYPDEDDKYILPVQHTRFENVLGATYYPTALVEAHVSEILYRATFALVDMLIAKPELVARVNVMDPLRRLELQSFIIFFATHIPPRQYKQARDILGSEITYYDNVRGSMGFALPGNTKQQIGLSDQEIKSFLHTRASVSPLDRLGRFTDLLTDLNIAAVYVLLDGLDEISETAGDYLSVATILIPLLANLNLMNNTPHLAFKVFAPTESAPFLFSADKVRRDRLAIHEIRLDETGLEEILTRRLTFCSNGAVSSMDAICAPELRGQMGEEMARRVDGNPRHLILLGDYMVRIRCRVADSEGDHEEYRLTADDLDQATIKLVDDFGQKQQISLMLENNAAKQEAFLRLEGDSLPDDWLRHALPAPLARAYLAYIRERLSHVRIWKLYDLVEACTAYVASILIMLVVQETGQDTLRRLEHAKLDMRRMFMGRWRHALDVLPGMCAGIGIRHPVIRSAHRWSQRHVDYLAEINGERNRSAHDGPQPEDVCDRLLASYDPPSHDFLSDLHALCKDLNLIKVDQIAKDGSTFAHYCTWYQGDTLSFPSLNFMNNIALESHRLWLVGVGEPINLHPLMIAATAPGSLIEEVWLYQAVENSMVSYKSYGTGRTLDAQDYRQVINQIFRI